MAVALVHHPVIDKNGETIAAAVTSLDLHDIARTARTFRAGPFYVVTPLEDQQRLVGEIAGHWLEGAGAKYNPHRKSALELIRIRATLEEAREDLGRMAGADPLTVVTSARMADSNLDFRGLRDLAAGGRPILLVFGTAWGLAPEIVDRADYRLTPIAGRGDYNHLAVRSAVAIVIDRMLGVDPHAGPQEG